MGKIFAMGLLLIVAAAGAALDFTLAAKHHPDRAYSLSDHLAFRAGTLDNAVAGLSAGPAILPPAPEGWTSHRALFEDSFRA